MLDGYLFIEENYLLLLEKYVKISFSGAFLLFPL